jgi:hypothetical protein
MNTMAAKIAMKQTFCFIVSIARIAFIVTTP